MTEFDSSFKKNSENGATNALQEARASVAEICAEFDTVVTATPDAAVNPLELPAVPEAIKNTTRFIGESLNNDPQLLKELLRTGTGNDLVLIRLSIEQLELYGEASAEFLREAAEHPTASIAIDAIGTLARVSIEQAGRCLNNYLLRPGLTEKDYDHGFSVIAHIGRDMLKYVEPAFLVLVKGEDRLPRISAQMFLTLLNEDKF